MVALALEGCNNDTRFFKFAPPMWTVVLLHSLAKVI